MRLWRLAIVAILVGGSGGGCTDDEEVPGPKAQMAERDAGPAPVDADAPLALTLAHATIRRGESANVRTVPLGPAPPVGTEILLRAPKELGVRATPVFVAAGSDDVPLVRIDVEREGPIGDFEVELGARDPNTEEWTWTRSAITLLKARGTLDPAFGNGGRLVLPALPPLEAIQCWSWVRLRVAGLREGELVVAQLLLNGALDPAFGTAGVTTIPIAGARGPVKFGYMNPHYLAVGGSALHVVRLLPRGAPDPAWGTAGVAMVSLREDVAALYLNAPSAGAGSAKACAATRGSSPGTEALACANFTASGELDATLVPGGIGLLESQPLGIRAFDWFDGRHFAGASANGRAVVEGTVALGSGETVLSQLRHVWVNGTVMGVVGADVFGDCLGGESGRGFFRTPTSFGGWTFFSSGTEWGAPVPAPFSAVIVRAFGRFTTMLAGHVISGTRHRAALGFFGGIDGVDAARTSWMALPDANVDESLAALDGCGTNRWNYAAGASGDSALVIRLLD